MSCEAHHTEMTRRQEEGSKEGRESSLTSAESIVQLFSISALAVLSVTMVIDFYITLNGGHQPPQAAHPCTMREDLLRNPGSSFRSPSAVMDMKRAVRLSIADGWRNVTASFRRSFRRNSEEAHLQTPAHSSSAMLGLKYSSEGDAQPIRHRSLPDILQPRTPGRRRSTKLSRARSPNQLLSLNEALVGPEEEVPKRRSFRVKYGSKRGMKFDSIECAQESGSDGGSTPDESPSEGSAPRPSGREFGGRYPSGDGDGGRAGTSRHSRWSKRSMSIPLGSAVPWDQQEVNRSRVDNHASSSHKSMGSWQSALSAETDEPDGPSGGEPWCPSLPEEGPPSSEDERVFEMEDLH
mmetsp:Transcript_37174/g.80930  ORF Transcript_37174/g.80930 Transcript_37174/m.80930 type:complete len:351 (-) Transcript_37174:175-1227(-)